MFITGGDINHTSVPGAASAWAAVTLLQSDYGGAYGRVLEARFLDEGSVCGWLVVPISTTVGGRS